MIVTEKNSYGNFLLSSVISKLNGAYVCKWLGNINLPLLQNRVFMLTHFASF